MATSAALWQRVLHCGNECCIVATSAALWQRVLHRYIYYRLDFINNIICSLFIALPRMTCFDTVNVMYHDEIHKNDIFRM